MVDHVAAIDHLEGSVEEIRVILKAVATRFVHYDDQLERMGNLLQRTIDSVQRALIEVDGAAPSTPGREDPPPLLLRSVEPVRHTQLEVNEVPPSTPRREVPPPPPRARGSVGTSLGSFPVMPPRRGGREVPHARDRSRSR